MIESRCGILCSECAYKEEVKCKGCMKITKPFWGEVCVVKDCCEKKEYIHCGECSIFPCDILHGFSYDENQGDKGMRIEQCRKWREESNGDLG